MKINYLVLTLLFLSIAFGVTAQVREATASMSQGTNNALLLDLDYADAEKVLDEFEKYVDDFKAKTKKKKGEVFADNAQVKSINGNNTIDIYARADKADTKSVLTVWFDLGGAYLSSKLHGEKYGEADKWLKMFAKRIVKKGIEDELKAEQKKVEIFADEQKNLTKEKEKLEKSIVEGEKAIKEMEVKIEQTKLNIDKAKQDVILNLDKQKLKAIDLEKQKETVKKVEVKLKDL